MASLFTPALGVPINTPITSNVITANFGAIVSVAITAGASTLVLNGVNVGSNATINDGDTLAISLSSSSTYVSATHTTITIGTLVSTFSTVTIEDPTLLLYPGYVDILPLDITSLQTGQDWVPNQSGNFLTELSSSGSLQAIVPIAPTSTIIPSINSYVTVANYFSDTISKVDAVTNTILSTIDVGRRPFGIAYTPTTKSDNRALTWVTCSGDNTVVCIDANNLISNTYATGGHPLGIAACTDGNHVWIANHLSGDVTHLTYDGTAWTSVQVTVAANPYAIVVDAFGTAWVTCSTGNQIYKITKANVVTAYVAGNSPRGIGMDAAGANVYVACSKDNTVVKLSTSTGGIVSTTNTGKLPYEIAMAPDDSVYVSCLISGTIQKIVGGIVITTTPTDPLPYGMSVSTQGSLWIANYYSNTPSFTYTKDYTPEPFVFAILDNLELNVPLTTEQITIRGVSDPTRISIPITHSATISINGGAAVTSGLVSNGDIFTVSYHTAMTYDTAVDIPVVIGTTVTWIGSKTRIEKKVPTAIHFTTLLNASAGTVYNTETASIQGIDATTVVPIQVEGGTLTINGNNTGAKTGNVHLGDTVSLRTTTSSDIAVASQHVTLTLNPTTPSESQAIWTILIAQQEYDYIKESYVHDTLYEVPFIPVQNQTTVTRITTTGSLSINDYNLAKEQPNGDPEVDKHRFVAAPIEGLVYEYLEDGSVATVHTISEVGSPIQTITVVRGSVHTTFVGTTSAKLVELGSTNPNIILPGAPSNIVASSDGTTIYLACPIVGSVAILHYNAASAMYELGAPIVTTGRPYSLAIDATGALWVSNLTTSMVSKYVNGVEMLQAHTGTDVWGMATTSTHLWTANSFDNTVSKINLVTGDIEATIPTHSAPSDMVYDGSSIWIAHFGTKDVIRLDPTSNLILDAVQLNNPVLKLSIGTTSHLWAEEQYPNINIGQGRTQPILPLVPLAFVDKINEPRSTVVKSDPVTITGLVRPSTVSISHLTGAILYVNSIPKGYSSPVANGDIVEISVISSDNYYTTISVNVVFKNVTSTFSVQTLPNLLPDTVNFVQITGAVPKSTQQSSNVIISGLTPGQHTTISISHSEWRYYINGVKAFAPTIDVVNGDIISIIGPVYGTYGATVTRDISALVSTTQVVFGTLLIVTQTLDGAIPQAPVISKDVPPFPTIPDRPPIRTLDIVYNTIVQPPLKTIVVGYTIHGNAFRAVDMIYIRNTRAIVKLLEPIYQKSDPKIFLPFESTFERNILPTYKFASSGYDRNIQPTFTFAVSGYERNVQPKFVSQAIGYDRNILPTHKFASSGCNRNVQQTFMFTVSNYDRNVLPTFKFGSSTGYDRDTRATLGFWTDSYERNTVQTFRHQSAGYDRNILPTFKFGVAGYDRNILPTFKFGVAGYDLSVQPAQKFSDVNQAMSVVRTERYGQMDIERHRIVNRFCEVLVERNNTSDLRTIDVQFVQTPISARAVDLKFAQEPVSFRTIDIVYTIEPISYRAVEANDELGSYVKDGTRPTPTIEHFYVKVGDQSRYYQPIPIKDDNHDRLIPTAAPLKSYVVNNYASTDTHQLEGTYLSVDEAISAGEAAGYAVVNATKLPGGHYMWNVPAALQSSTCDGSIIEPPPSGIPKPSKWYVHGG